jgi:hypothetical protein
MRISLSPAKALKRLKANRLQRPRVCVFSRKTYVRAGGFGAGAAFLVVRVYISNPLAQPEGVWKTGTVGSSADGSIK